MGNGLLHQSDSAGRSSKIFARSYGRGTRGSHGWLRISEGNWLPEQQTMQLSRVGPSSRHFNSAIFIIVPYSLPEGSTPRATIPPKASRSSGYLVTNAFITAILSWNVCPESATLGVWYLTMTSRS